MNFALTILGVNGATPAHGRFPTSQYLQIRNHHFLIDCGEGAQIRLTDYRLPSNKINHIFISHLHGDHIFGLPGLLFSYALNNRTKPLNIYSPMGLEIMIKALLMPGGSLPYPIIFHEINPNYSDLIFENDDLTVHTIPLKHWIPTCGFLFRETPFQQNIIPEKINELVLTIPQIIEVKEGRDILLENGQTIRNTELTFSSFLRRSYAFMSDTMYQEEILSIINKVDLLYHETTFCNDAKEKAIKTMHSTAEQAATIAKKANVSTLITGHYSSMYIDLEIFLTEARAIFPNTLLGLEGKKYEVERKREIDN